MNSRPVCASADQTQCLASSPATGTALTTPFVLSANAWASDNTLTFDFGVQHPDGTQCAPLSLHAPHSMLSHVPAHCLGTVSAAELQVMHVDSMHLLVPKP